MHDPQIASRLLCRHPVPVDPLVRQHHTMMEPAASASSEQAVMEYQIQSQRGLVLFGFPFYSEKLLGFLDPKPFSKPNGEPLGQSFDNLQVPDDTWEWVWPRWFVDMANDVDDQGWVYSWWFRSKHWTGYPQIGRRFVRQRRWKRLRRKKLAQDGSRTELSLRPEQLEGLFAEIAQKANDRERVDAIVSYATSHTDQWPLLQENMHLLFDTLSIPASRNLLVQRFTRVPELACSVLGDTVTHTRSEVE